MTNPTEERVRALLATVIDPHTGQDLAAGGAIKGIGVDLELDPELALPGAVFEI